MFGYKLRLVVPFSEWSIDHHSHVLPLPGIGKHGTADTECPVQLGAVDEPPALFFRPPKLKRPVTATQVLRWEDVMAGRFVMVLQKMVFLPL